MSPQKQERAKILELIESGVINAEEGIQLLRAVAESADSDQSAGTKTASRPGKEQRPLPENNSLQDQAAQLAAEDLEKWRTWWRTPFLIGAGCAILFAAGAIIIYGSQKTTFWFYLTWPPIVAGSLLAILAYWSRHARWLHIRIKDNAEGNGARFALSFPIPIRFTAWLLRRVGRFIPQLNQTGVDELILALGETATPENPLHVQVGESGDEEEVQVYIG